MTFQELIDFIQLGSPVPVIAGPNIPKNRPTSYVLLTPYGGGSEQMEGVYETQPWQVRTVGKQAQADSGQQKASMDAYETAKAIDLYIRGRVYPSPWPRFIGSTKVQYAIRSGSGPVPLPADSGGRSHYVASYLFQVATGL